MPEPSPRGLIAAVDDDESILWSLGSLLESADYDVQLFTSAEGFLESNCLGNINCLISDIDMPRVDGFELVAVARAVRPQLPVILITGYPDALKLTPSAGVDAPVVLTKPFRADALLGAVQRAMESGAK